MKLFVFIITLCLLKLCATREISRETLNSLGKSIEDFKQLGADQHKSTLNKIPVIETIVYSDNSKECGHTARNTYQQCILLAETMDAQTNCFDKFINTYPKCYFGKHLYKGDKNLFQCEKSCLQNFDKCLFDSSKTESFVCIHGRKSCQKNCPWSMMSLQDNDLVQKRTAQACHNDCEGMFDLCMFARYGESVGISLTMKCNLERSRCRNEEC